MIDKTNLDKYRDYFSPGVQWTIEHDVTVKVGPYKKIEHSPPFLAATEKYSAQVKLSDDGLRLLNHVAGMPFTNIDPNEPFAAAKHMYNFNAAIAVDDLDLRNFDCDTGTIGSDGDPLKVERHFLLEHIATSLLPRALGRGSEAGNAEQGRGPLQGGSLPVRRALRPEGHGLHAQPLH